MLRRHIIAGIYSYTTRFQPTNVIDTLLAPGGRRWQQMHSVMELKEQGLDAG